MLKTLICLILAGWAAFAQDASTLKDGEVLPVKLEAQDKQELDSLAAQISALQQRVEAKKDAIRAKYKAQGWSKCNNGLCLAVCSPDIWFDLEWRGEWLLITKRVGHNPCGLPALVGKP